MKKYHDPIYAYKSTLSWSNETFSDSLAFLKAYKMFKTLESTFYSNSFAENWCLRNNIDYFRLLELDTLVSEITARLKYNLKISVNPQRISLYKKHEQDLMLKVVIAGAFYPNYFIQNFIMEKDLEKYPNLSKNTVILSGFDKDSITTALYIPVLKEKFKDCSSKIDFRIDGQIVYMTFDSNNHEISVNNDDHTLYHSFTSHIHSNQQTDSNLFNLNFKKNSNGIHTSVYISLAYKKIYQEGISIHRFMPEIEKSFRKELLK